MQVAWLFPGQGTQVVGMGRELISASPAAKSVFDRAVEALAVRPSTPDLASLVLDGPEDELTLTINAQPAIVATSMATLAAIHERYPELPAPRFAAGHSLGEYSALVATGALSLEDAVYLVRERGYAMQTAVAPGIGTMAAIFGLEAERLEALCTEVSETEGELVSCANFNAPGQIVIAGTVKAVGTVRERVGALGGKGTALKVSAPFHCKLMAPAAHALAAELERVAIGPFAFPIVANVDARPNSEPSRVKELLVRQVDGAVRWEQTIRLMHAEGITHAIEIGPGKVLANLGKRIAKEIKIASVGDVASLDALGDFIASAKQ